MDGDDSISEDEWSGLRRRFTLEGIEWESLDPNNRSLHVWRWVVDAEANLKACRHINDKLRRQHDQEKEELEEYTEHIRVKCEERVKELDMEIKSVREDLEALLAGTEAVTTMFLNEGLQDIANSTLGEQIAYLIVERTKLNEELATARTTPPSEHERELTGQLIKVSTDYELLKRTHQGVESQLTEMTDRVALLEKASRQLEVDNENLAYKLSEAMAEIEDNEGQLRRFAKNASFWRSESPYEDLGPASLRSLPLSETPFVRTDSCRRSFPRRESLRNSGRQKKREPIKAERGRSPRSSHGRQRPRSRSGSVVKDDLDDRSAVPPLPFDESGIPCLSRRSLDMSASPQKLHSLLDDQIQSSKNQINKLEEVQTLQVELDKIKKDLVGAGDKYEFIIRKYELYKIKSKNKLLSMRSYYEAELETLKRKIVQLEAEVALHADQLHAEELLKKHLEDDLSALRLERQEMAMRVRESERQVKDYNHDIQLLQEKVELVQTSNRQLTDKLQELNITAIVG